MAPSASAPRPYRGPHYYDTADAGLFFGRDRESEQLLAQILSSRFTLLHAQSGAGKTSLLNARLIPGLEQRGLIPVRILPQNDPSQSTRATTTEYVLPDPQLEARSLENAAEALLGSDLALPVGALLHKYDELPMRHADRRRLIAPLSRQGASPLVPIFSRVLRCSVELDSFVEHVNALRAMAGASSASMDETTPLAQLLQTVRDDAAREGHRLLVERLAGAGSELWEYFEALVEAYGSLRSRFGLVLIFDQFEELFTRFGEARGSPAGSTGPADWRLREAFFSQFERLYRATYIPHEPDGHGVPFAPGPLPIRYVVSMRDEWVASLDRLASILGSIVECRYHLRLLEKQQAEVAISEPAACFGYSYSPDCYQLIVRQLLKEDRFVEPAHVQVVCERLWRESGRTLAGQVDKELDDEQVRNLASSHGIALGTFKDLGYTRGILTAFLDDVLTSLGETNRQEAIALLQPLITSSGTRNIVEISALVDAPFVDHARRREVLDVLVRQSILRVEQRLGGMFVEITHEFLIQPALDAIRRGWGTDVESVRLRWALMTLERYASAEGRAAAERVLMKHEFLSLHENRRRVRWEDGPWSIELMLRSAIALGMAPTVVKEWVSAFEGVPPVNSARVLEELSTGRRRLLSLEELGAVNAERSRLQLDARAAELLLRSELALASDRDAADIVYWTRSVQR